ncbi:MAG: GDP-mannose 4,6-dehydratase [Candidatus Margulisbacteria bacterium]|nr:GDP-mannose 4,6-dehydratase [Candidatus Margulisiibacteriota bacterium]
MKTVLLTGVAGFIASRTAKVFLDKGISVVGVDNLNDYYDVKLKNYRLTELNKTKGFTFYKGDIEDRQFLESLFQQYQFDAVVNLAARAGVRYSMTNPFVYLSTNAMGTLNLLELMKEFGVNKMVLASTSSLYAGQQMPFTEDLAVNEPISPYAASKKAAEVMCYSYKHLYNLDISIVRYFTVFGPAGRPDMSIFRFIKWVDEGTPIELFGDGTQSRDFTYVEDIARGTVLATEKKVGYEILNLGGGQEPITMNKVIKMIESLLGKKAIVINKPFHKADLLETSADISKAEKLLGWKPSISFEEGLSLTIDWYKENKNWLTSVVL